MSNVIEGARQHVLRQLTREELVAEIKRRDDAEREEVAALIKKLEEKGYEVKKR